MAITVTQQPPILTPAYGDIVITASSNLVVTKFKFKYVFDILTTNGSGGITNYVGRIKQTPNPSGVGMLDLSRFLQNVVATLPIAHGTGSAYIAGGTAGSLAQSLTTLYTLGNTTYVVNCGEEYAETANGTVSLYNGNGTLSTGTTLTSVTTTTGSTFNAVKQFEEGFNFDPTPYVAPTGRKLLTNSPRTLYKETEEYFVYGTLFGTFSGTTFGITGTTFAEVYNQAGTLIKTYNPSSGTTNSSVRIATAYGSNKISTIVAGYEDTWYRIVLRIGGQTESITIINKICPLDKYEPKDILFVNRLNGWDTFRFYGSKDEQVKIERGTYQRAYGTWAGSTYNYNTSERGTTNIKTDLTVEGEVMSDFLERDTVNWLEELLTSPTIYIIEESGKLTPINIKNTSFKNQLRGNVKLRQVAFSYEKSNEKSTQQQ